MSGLMLDTPTSGLCTREEAYNQKLIPKATDTYQPLPNKVLIDMIYGIAKENGMSLENEQLGMDLKGQRFFGVCDIEGYDFFGGHIQMMIGFCNSYNGTMSARLCLGGTTLVCSNRAFYAYTDEYTGISAIVVQPHKNLNSFGVHEGLVTHIKKAFGQIENFRSAQESFYEGLISYKISDNRAYAAIIRAAQAGVINKTTVLTLAEEWNYQAHLPEKNNREWHEEFQDRNAYSLFNAFTQINKIKIEKNPVPAFISTIDLTKFFCEEFNLA